MNFKVVLFDLDDTLCDTSASKKRVFELMYEKNPKLQVLSKDRVVYLLLSEREKYIKKQRGFQSFSRSEFWFSALRDLNLSLSVSELKKLIDDYWKFSLEELTLFPNVKNVLETIFKSTCKSALVAGGDFYSKASKLIHLKIDRFFNYVFTSDVLQKQKTSVMMYKNIIQYLGMEPKLIIMVGNDPIEDILPAKKAGIITVQTMMVGNEKLPRFKQIKPDYTIYNIDELQNILHV